MSFPINIKVTLDGDELQLQEVFDKNSKNKQTENEGVYLYVVSRQKAGKILRLPQSQLDSMLKKEIISVCH